MTASGWMIMIVSVSSVSLLMAWCIYKVMSTPGETEHVHGFEQEPPDTK